MVRCVEVQIAQVLDNLLRNAIDELKDLPLDRRKVLLQASWNNNKIEFKVTDWGNGVCESTSVKLFDQFFTTKANGMGVGLSICRSIIEQHGGEITLDQTEHGGAAFRFTIQRYCAEIG